MSKWKIDSAASSVGFSVPHMMVSTVTGNFRDFSGNIEGDPADLSKSTVQFQVSVASIDTDNKERDIHLCSKDFFDAAAFPYMTFISRSIYWMEQEGMYRMNGDLTIKQTTKKVLFCVTPIDPGNFEACYEADAKLKRKEFDLTWNRAIEAGGVMVGDTIDIQLTIAVRKNLF
ncbi:MULTISPECIES: YceI family protein [unclassified Sporosarcina]|uniref:YceI family protein n=1 Tax=unclassified Sporosarcina TaxID=2647733 RepID=UPI00203AB0BC|nr:MULTISPECIES: YceI family protein [unclassified Sporosarcina]GKV65435.1 polyisoprenoid-binding protein [Sporosarcina sp. NCCP-2331]GLB55559.1 polyisoprenoid-binding protein [Sporosarcina sp. NCCP-2378]